TPLLPHSLLELLALFVQPRGLRLFASFEKGALRVGDLGRCRVTGFHPSPCFVDSVPAQEQPFGTSFLVPTRCEVSNPGMRPNPLQIDAQSFGKLRQWPRKSAVERHELETPELFGNVVIGNRLEDNRQEPL